MPAQSRFLWDHLFAPRYKSEMGNRKNVVLGHMRAGARISRRGQRAPQGDGGPGSKLHLLFTPSRAAQLIEPDVFS